MLLIVIMVVLSLGVLRSSTASAEAPLEKGLLITPLRQFLSVDAGATTTSQFTIANLTNAPLEVTLSVQQFSVTDYAYTYQFNTPVNNWLHLGQSSITLKPNQSQDIPYGLTVPSGSTPGGQYYTLFASADTGTQGVRSIIQATDLLYVTVNGHLSHTTQLQSSSMPSLVFGRTIPYSLQPIDTGNVHTFVYASGQLHGLFTNRVTAAATHLLMPDKVRSLSGTIPSPILPGVYRATFGYKTDTGQQVSVAHYVVYIPPWFIALVLAGLLALGRYWPRRRKTE